MRPVLRRRIALATLAGVVILGACTSSDETLVPTTTSSTEAPVVAPGTEHGTLLRAEEVDADGLAGTLSTIRYTSEAVDGSPIQVTGVAMVPRSAPPPGGFPVLSWAHGTTGVADACAPSRVPGKAINGVAAFVDAGFVVVASDYEGLGTDGTHPYLVSTSEGRSVLDAARAARGLDVPLSGQVVLAGVSQGGHAALAAAELAPTWTPELDLRGTIAMTPVANLDLIAPALFTDRAIPSLGLLVAAGWVAAYDDLALGDVLTAEGERIVDEVVLADCIVDVVTATAEFTVDDLVAVSPLDVPGWAERIAENTIHADAVTGPVYLAHGEADELIPLALSGILAGQLCEAGVVTQYVTYPGASHSGVFVDSLADSVAWATARLGDDAVASTCPAA